MGSGPHKLTETMESLYAARCAKESGSHHLSLIAASLPNLSICLALVSQPALILKVCLALGLCLDFLNFWCQNIDCYFWVTQDWGSHEAICSIRVIRVVHTNLPWTSRKCDLVRRQGPLHLPGGLLHLCCHQDLSRGVLQRIPVMTGRLSSRGRASPCVCRPMTLGASQSFGSNP